MKRFVALILGIKIGLLGISLLIEKPTEIVQAYEDHRPVIEIMTTSEYEDYLEEKNSVPILIEAEIEWTKERIERMIAETWPENPQLAIAIAKSESGPNLNQKAYNPEVHNGCNGSYGIMQVACVHEEDPEKLYDVEYNLKRAREIYDEKGWQPWGGYTSGGYKKFLVK